MRVEHADLWLGFTADQITRWCSFPVGLEELSLEALGMQ